MSQQLVKVDPTKLVTSYQQGFSRLLPSHMREDGGGDQWIAGVKSLLATRPEIAEAASNSRDHFLAALIQAAQKGLQPGTKEFHLVPFAPKKGQPRLIQGVEGYQGIVERIYRAGAVSTVIAEAVYDGDQFDYQPGRGQPVHVVDWFGERGKLRGAYAYAMFRDGAVSKVVVVGPKEIAQAKAKSASAHSEYSPWQQFPEAMWVKTAVRKLENWVPTSAEYRRQQLRDAQAVADERQRDAQIVQQFDEPPMPAAAVNMASYDEDEVIDPETGEVIVDAVLVDEPDTGEGRSPASPVSERETPTIPPVDVSRGPKTRPATGAKAAGGTPVAAGAGEVVAADGPATTSAPVILQHQEEEGPAEDDVVDEAVQPLVDHRPGPIRASQKTKLRAECIRLNIQAVLAEKLMWFDLILGTQEPLTALDQLDVRQADQLLEFLAGVEDRAALEAWGAGQNALVDEAGE